MSAGARDFCKDIVPAPTNARRGCAPPGASRQTWLLAPPHEWAYPAHTRGSFRFTTKGTKGVPGALSLDPAGGYYHPTRKGHHPVQLKSPPRTPLFPYPRNQYR